LILLSDDNSGIKSFKIPVHNPINEAYMNNQVNIDSTLHVVGHSSWRTHFIRCYLITYSECVWC